MFGYTHEELKIIVAPMAPRPVPSRSARWAPTPRSPCCRERPRLLFDYFQQLFAQVTNPPLDAIREEVVTAVGSTVGPEANLLAPGPESCRQLVLPFPIIDNDELAKIIHINADGRTSRTSQASTISGLYPGRRRRAGARSARSTRSAREVSAAIEDGARIIVLSRPQQPTRSTRRSRRCC